MRTEELAAEVLHRLAACGLTLATAESCTGGLIGKLLTDIPGSSAVYMGGVISYVDDVKKRLLGVSAQTLSAYTAVSRQTAVEMAKGAREAARAGVGVSVTGLAGPDGDGTGRPIGLVYIAMDMEHFSYNKELHLTGSRAQIREEAARAVFEMLLESLS